MVTTPGIAFPTVSRMPYNSGSSVCVGEKSISKKTPHPHIHTTQEEDKTGKNPNRNSGIYNSPEMVRGKLKTGANHKDRKREIGAWRQKWRIDWPTR